MKEVFKFLSKQPVWILGMILGTALTALPCVTIDKDNHFNSHPPSTLIPVAIGLALIVFSIFSFFFVSVRKSQGEESGLDFTLLEEDGSAVQTTVSGCTIRVIEGRIEEHANSRDIAVALPCNEYFDDGCVEDTRSALGSFVARAFDGRASEFVALSLAECRNRLGPGTIRPKSEGKQAISFGFGQCILLRQPFGCLGSVALVSTTTQRSGEGLASRISYLFSGIDQLTSRLADARLNEVVMPIFGAGHGGVAPPMALVGLLLALAEAARYGQGGKRLRRATVVVFKATSEGKPQVDRVVVRRALALVGSRN